MKSMMKVKLTVTVLLVMAFGSVSANAGETLVINEIMNNPSAVGDATGEWVEIYNPEVTATDLNGWTLKDNGSNLHIISSSVIVPAQGYAVLANESDPGLNGGLVVDYVYSNISFGNGSDELVLINPTELEIDRVEYDNGATFPDPTGASMMLKCDQTDTASNDLGGNWLTSIAAFGDGDLGTPGANNCLVNQVGDMDKNGRVGLEEAIIALQIVAGIPPGLQLGTYVSSIGDAVEGDVLYGKTFSNVSTGGIEGTMPDNEAVTITPTISDITIAKGYHNGSGKCEGDINLQPDKIKQNQTIFGVMGTVYQFWGCRQASWDVFMCIDDCLESMDETAISECSFICGTRFDNGNGVSDEDVLCTAALVRGLTKP